MSSAAIDPRRGSRQSPAHGVATAVVVTVLVAIFLISFSFYVPLLWGPSSQPPSPHEMEFSLVDLDSQGNASWLVGAVLGGPYSSGGFSMRLTVNGESITWAPLGETDSGILLVVGSHSYRVVWTDVDGDGSVSLGDRFRVTGDGIPLPSASTFEFTLKWSESWLSKASWSTG